MSAELKVSGGTLHVGTFGFGDGPAKLLAIHGITANHTSMKALSDALGDEYTVIAPDLRGRGKSNNITGPFGMAAHADDMVSVLDHFGIDQIDVLGHSMGGFVAVVLAHRAPERVRRIILVDGGITLNLPEAVLAMPPEQLVQAVIGPALARLDMTFDSPEAYLDFWRPHPALADDWNSYVEDHYRYDLNKDGDVYRSGVNKDAIVADGSSGVTDPTDVEAIENLKHPTYLLRAPRGLFNEVPPLYTDEYIATWTARFPNLHERVVDDVNHYTIGLTERGTKAIAEVVRDTSW